MQEVGKVRGEQYRGNFDEATHAMRHLHSDGDWVDGRDCLCVRCNERQHCRESNVRHVGEEQPTRVGQQQRRGREQGDGGTS